MNRPNTSPKTSMFTFHPFHVEYVHNYNTIHYRDYNLVLFWSKNHTLIWKSWKATNKIIKKYSLVDMQKFHLLLNKNMLNITILDSIIFFVPSCRWINFLSNYKYTSPQMPRPRKARIHCIHVSPGNGDTFRSVVSYFYQTYLCYK